MLSVLERSIVYFFVSMFGIIKIGEIMELFFLWFGLSVLFFVFEFLGRAIFLSLPFCLGALITALTSFFVSGVGCQLSCFLCVSLFFLAILRVFFNPERFQKSEFKKQLVGKRAVVSKTIVPALAGKVIIDGKAFDAQSASGEIILAGTQVIIVEFKNTCVFVQ